jgi:LysM repeat protein
MPTPTPLIYVVQPGDTLFSIASQYGITIEALCEANDLEDCNLIYPGDELIIPSEGGPSPTPKAEQPAQIAAPAANPRDLGPTSAEGQAELVIANDSPYLLTLEFTGPITQTITVEPCPDCEEYTGFGPIVCRPGRPDTTFKLSPGTYEVTAKVSQADITPFSATWELEADHSYSQCFYAVSEFE